MSVDRGFARVRDLWHINTRRQQHLFKRHMVITGGVKVARVEAVAERVLVDEI